MDTVRSADGTTIAYSQAGQGPPLILVDGALCCRSFGPMTKLAELLASRFTVYTYDRRGRGESSDTPPYSPDREIEDLEALMARAGETVLVHGTSSGAALALEAAKRNRAIARLAVYEPPFIVDDARTPIPDGFLDDLKRLVADGRSGDAVKTFMRFVGTPGFVVRILPTTPFWPKLKAMAHTLPYDITIVQDHQQGAPFTPAQWKEVTTPTLVAAGGKSPAWMTNAAHALAEALPDASYQFLPGQTHTVKAQAMAPVLTEFFLAGD